MDTRKSDLEIERIHADINKLMAETMKLHAEAARMTRERWWFPAVALPTALGIGIALARFLMG